MPNITFTWYDKFLSGDFFHVFSNESSFSFLLSALSTGTLKRGALCREMDGQKHFQGYRLGTQNHADSSDG